MKRLSISGFIFMLFIGMIGCKTAERALNKGAKLEAEGRYAEAVEYYITALERNENIEGGVESLRTASNQAMQIWWDEVVLFKRQQDFTAAAQKILLIDALEEKIRTYQVYLDVPQNYTSERRSILDQAIQKNLDFARQASLDGNWEAAIQAYNEASTFEPSGAQAREIETAQTRAYTAWSDDLRNKARIQEDKNEWDNALRLYDEALQYAQTDAQENRLNDDRYRVLTTWSDEAMRYGRFRMAYDRATAALEIFPNSDNAQRLIDEALRRGTIRVVAFPLWRTASAAVDMPVDFMTVLNEELQYGHWDQAPLFIAMADPRDTRNELRRENATNSVLSSDEVNRMGKRLDAHLVTYGEVTRYSVTEEIDREVQKTARLRNGGGTVNYTEQRVKREVFVVVAFRVVDPRNGSVIFSTNVESREATRYLTTNYTGDDTELDLGRSERRLFNGADKQDKTRELDTKLSDELAKKIADIAYRELLDEIE